MRRTRDSSAKLRAWECVDKGFNLVLTIAVVASVVFGVVTFVGLFIGCTPQTGNEGVQWPPDVQLQAADLEGYVDLDIGGKVQRVALRTETTGGNWGNSSGVSVVGWGVSATVDASVNGRVQSALVNSTNRLDGDRWVHCLDAGLAIEFADQGTAKATGIPPGFSPECGLPGVSVSVPFLGWDFELRRGGASVGGADSGPGEEPAPDPPGGAAQEPMTPMGQ